TDTTSATGFKSRHRHSGACGVAALGVEAGPRLPASRGPRISGAGWWVNRPRHTQIERCRRPSADPHPHRALRASWADPGPPAGSLRGEGTEMQPYWQSDNGETRLTIYQGDALNYMRQMPDESVDFIFTDPPYGHNNNNNGDLISRWE